MSPRQRDYTSEFKAEAVRLVLAEGYKRSEVGRNLGVSPKNISRWVLESQRQRATESHGSLSELALENKRLREENRRLQMEREILKKAAAFFAKENL